MGLTKDRRLVGFLKTSDDDSFCYEPRIEERWMEPVSEFIYNPETKGYDEITAYEERTELVWGGTFTTDPSSWEIEDLKGELAGQCEKLGLEEDVFSPGTWEREL